MMVPAVMVTVIGLRMTGVMSTRMEEVMVTNVVMADIMAVQR